jgi:hypothetical protein
MYGNARLGKKTSRAANKSTNGEQRGPESLRAHKVRRPAGVDIIRGIKQASYF